MSNTLRQQARKLRAELKVLDDKIYEEGRCLEEENVRVHRQRLIAKANKSTESLISLEGMVNGCGYRGVDTEDAFSSSSHDRGYDIDGLVKLETTYKVRDLTQPEKDILISRQQELYDQMKERQQERHDRLNDY